MAGFAIYCRHIIVKAAPAAITGPFQSAGAAPIKAFTRKMGRKKMKERKISPKNLRTYVFIGVDEKVTSSWKRKKDDTNEEGNGGENSNKTISRGSGSST